MRPIETAPKDGQVIILKDGATGIYEVAHWSPFGEWVSENGEPSKITPTHWYPMPRDESLLQEHNRSAVHGGDLQRSPQLSLRRRSSG